VDWGGECDGAGLEGDHGGKWEASHMMTAAAETGDLQQLKDNPDYIGVASGADEVDSTPEQGAIWAEQCSAAIAAEAKWLVDNYPDLPIRVSHSRNHSS
jgi:hypothetical protein